MFRAIRHIVRYQDMLRGNIPEYFEVSIANDPKTILEARRLHARRYLKWGYVDQSDLTTQGVLRATADPHVGSSVYFVVRDNRLASRSVVAVARQIGVSVGGDHAQLPTISELALQRHLHRSILRYDANSCVEISALAKDAGVDPIAPFLLYRAMWQHSLRHGHLLWIMGVDNQVFQRLKAVYSRSLIEIGSPALYMGSMVTPVALEVPEALDELVSQLTRGGVLGAWRKRLAAVMLDGLDDSALSLRHVDSLARAGIELPREKVLR